MNASQAEARRQATGSGSAPKVTHASKGPISGSRPVEADPGPQTPTSRKPATQNSSCSQLAQQTVGNGPQGGGVAAG